MVQFIKKKQSLYSTLIFICVLFISSCSNDNNRLFEEKMDKLTQLIKELDSAVAAEQKGKGYISNVNVLIKTGETSTYKKKAETSLKKVSNLEQRINVLLYNVKYCEKQIAKFVKSDMQEGPLDVRLLNFLTFYWYGLAHSS